MVGQSNPNGYGFFGQGYWGRKVFWEKIPIEHRNLDTDGYLEGLLKTWGDECESFLTQIGLLPLQREPYIVRAIENEGEWFYFTESFTYTDDYWGKVVRLIGEKIYSNMPNHDEDNVPTSDADELVKWWSWWPYTPISKIARWWNVNWNGVNYEVSRVRTRSFDWPDTPYNSSSSQANEIWLKGGDLQIFFDYLSDDATWRDDWTVIGEGDGSNSQLVEFPHVPVRLYYNDTSGSPPWLISNAKLKLRLDLVSGGEYYDLYDVPDGTVDETGNLYPQSIDASNSGGTISFSFSGNTVTITDTASLFTPGMVGNTIRVTGTSLNNGVFEVLYYVDANNLRYINTNGSIESASLANAWEVGDGEINTTTSYGTIDYQTGKLNIDLSAIGDTTTPGSSIFAKWYVRGYYVPFYPPRVIDYLSRDFGFENDKNDPEDVQRSTIANITKYHGLKATQDSYRIRGEISLFSVYARSLWRMCDIDLWTSLPIEHKFKYNGNMYTDITPRQLRFDDISGDEQLFDPDDSTWKTLLDNSLMYQDASTDGFSIGLAYSLDVTQGYYGQVAIYNSNDRVPAGVISSTVLSYAESLSYGFRAGYRVVVRMEKCQYYAFNFRKGIFGLTEYSKPNGIHPDIGDSIFWIDAVDVAWNEIAWPGIILTDDEVWGDWTIIIGVGVDSNGNPLDGPTVGHAIIVAVNQGAKKFTISGDHTGSISPGDMIYVMRSPSNDGNYTVNTVTLVGSNTEIVVLEAIPSPSTIGMIGWIDVAVKYYPEIDSSDCCFCRSYKMRVEIEPTDEAYEYYTTNDSLDSAIDRMKNKIAPPIGSSSLLFKPSLIPIHTRVVDWAIKKEWILENVHSGNTIDEELTVEFLSDSISDISGIDQINQIFTINGDKRGLLASGDKIDIRDSTGNDGSYDIVSLTLNNNGIDTDVEVGSAIASAVVDGSLYLRPSKILMNVDQRGDMSSGQLQTIRVYNEIPAIVWSTSSTTNISDPDTWYSVISNYDITNDIGNNSPVKIEAIGSALMTYGDVRFTFTTSKYKR